MEAAERSSFQVSVAGWVAAGKVWPLPCLGACPRQGAGQLPALKGKTRAQVLPSTSRVSLGHWALLAPCAPSHLGEFMPHTVKESEFPLAARPLVPLKGSRENSPRACCPGIRWEIGFKDLLWLSLEKRRGSRTHSSAPSLLCAFGIPYSLNCSSLPTGNIVEVERGLLEPSCYPNHCRLGSWEQQGRRAC